MKQLFWGLVGLCWAVAGTAMAQTDLPAADAQTTVAKLGLGPTRVYRQWTGKARVFHFFRRKADYYTAEDFSFTFETDGHGSWLVISREPTPFEQWRFGTTFTGLAVDWAAGPRVRVLAVKGIDRLPPKFLNYKLDPDRTLTALIVEVWSGGRWRPWFINNWFHPWGTPADSALIVSHYVGRPSPAFDVYGFKGDISAELNERSRKLVAEHPDWRAYHGRVVVDPQSKHGWALDLLHVFARNPKTGGYEAVVGDPRTLVPLNRPAPAVEKSSRSGVPSADWTMVYNGPTHANTAGHELAPPLKVKWVFRAARGFAGSPAVAGGRVFCGNDDGKLYCVDAATGKQLWTFATGTEVESTPAIAAESVIFGSFDGNVYALDAASGAKRWSFVTGPRLPGLEGVAEVKQGVDSSPAVVNDQVYFGAWDGKMYCLELATGKRLWSAPTKGPFHFGSPAVAKGRVFLGTADGLFHCWDAASGKLLWEKRLADAHIDHLMCSPAVHDGVVFAGSGYAGPLFALEAATGKERWRFPMKNLVCGTLTVHGGRVFAFADGGGQVVCLDVRTGSAVWEARLGKGWGAGAPVVAGRFLYLTMRDGSVSGQPAGLAVLEAATGRAAWSSPTGPAWGSCAIAGDTLYYGSDNGCLYALSRH
jgi:outer membrane protein assembly factor BamB